MKLAVFGPTGATGGRLVEYALAAGFHVVAYARNTSGIASGNERLTIVQGELSDTAAIERAVDGAGAVISLLGPRPREDISARPLTRGMRNILAAMRKAGSRRLVISSTPSASDPHDAPDLRFKVLVAIVKHTMRPAYNQAVDFPMATVRSGLGDKLADE